MGVWCAAPWVRARPGSQRQGLDAAPGRDRYRPLYLPALYLRRRGGRWLCEKVGTYSLALRLDEMGIAPPGGATCWSSTTIQQILQNPVYIGKIRWNVRKSKKRITNKAVRVERYTAPPEEQVLVDGLHPAIVDEAVFLAAQGGLEGQAS